MKKRLATGLLVSGLMAATLPGVASADPHPDSAAGYCGQVHTDNPGLGDSIGRYFLPAEKAYAEVIGVSLGAKIRGGFSVAVSCAPGARAVR